MEKEFNLIDEPWICVRITDCTVKEVSLRELFFNAHHYIELAGESKPQDFAILRLCLALMHTIFSRFDVEGDEIDTDESNQMLDSWKAMWEQKQFPEKPFDRYFEEWHDKFWLFDEKEPFYQSNVVNGKTKEMVKTSKLIGTLFQSENKARVFADRKNESLYLSYAEATRWLLHINCFDDIAAKKPTPKKPYVGQLGLIAIKGRNLFETLLLNFTVTMDEDDEKIQYQTPYWEITNKSNEFNHLIAIPNNQAALLTLQSRRIYLVREKEKVIGYYISGGDYFEEEDIYIEQMTLWLSYSENKKKNSKIKYKPQRHSPSKKAWQEFGSIATFIDDSLENNEAIEKRIPGVISWIQWLLMKGHIDKNYSLNISTAAIIYDFGQATSLPVKDLIEDSLTFHFYLILEDYKEYSTLICKEIKKCEEAAKAVKQLSINLQTSAGASGDKLSGNDAMERLYGKFDLPFRLWLKDLGDINIEDSKLNIETTLREICLNFSDELATAINDASIFGRYKSNKDKKDKTIYSSAQALNIFHSRINKIFK